MCFKSSSARNTYMKQAISRNPMLLLSSSLHYFSQAFRKGIRIKWHENRRLNIYSLRDLPILPISRCTLNIKTNISLNIHLRFTKYPVIDLASVIYNKPEILPNPIKHFLNKTRSTCYTPFYWVVHLIGSSHLICY